MVDGLLFIGKFSDINVVFKATARQYGFASILSVLGKLVKPNFRVRLIDILY